MVHNLYYHPDITGIIQLEPYWHSYCIIKVKVKAEVDSPLGLTFQDTGIAQSIHSNGTKIESTSR